MDNKEIQALIADAVKEAVAPLAEQLKAVDDAKETKSLKLDGMSDDDKKVLFFKSIFTGDVETIKAINSGLSDGAGGYVVPEEWAKEIDRVAGDFGVARRIARVVPMTSDTLHLPKAGSTGVTAYWVTQGSAITESNPTFDETLLEVKDLAGVSAFTNSWVDDANVDVVNYLIELLGEALAGQEDEEAFNGDGSAPEITGVLQSDDVTVVTMASGDDTFEEIGAEDLYATVFAVPHQIRAGAKWVMSDYVFSLVNKLEDDYGRPLFRTLNESDKGMLLGYPVEISSTMPEATDTGADEPVLAFGNFKKGLVIGKKKDMSISISDQATVGTNNLWEKNMSAVRVIERLDIAVHIGEAIAVLKTHA